MSDSIIYGLKTPRILSTPDELLRDENTAGRGAPAHTPNAIKQTYVNLDTGEIYEWWGGVWH